MRSLNRDWSAVYQDPVTAGIVAAGTVGGAYLSSKAAGRAADAAESGADAAAAETRYEYDTSRKDLAPWRNVGVGALGKLAALYGINASTSAAPGEKSRENFDTEAYLNAHPELRNPAVWDTSNKDYYDHWVASQANGGGFDFPYLNKPSIGQAAAGPDYTDFYSSPDYQFTFGEGQRAVNAGLAARGLSNSGRAMKELTRYGQGAASTQLNNYRNALASLAGIGQTATTNTASLGANAATNIGQSYQNAADARASGYLGQANSLNNAINQGTGLYALSRLYGGAGYTGNLAGAMASAGPYGLGAI